MSFSDMARRDIVCHSASVSAQNFMKKKSLHCDACHARISLQLSSNSVIYSWYFDKFIVAFGILEDTWNYLLCRPRIANKILIYSTL